MPEIDFDEFIGEGPFESNFSLRGNFSEKATSSNPTIQGKFNYSFTLPEEILDIENPFEIPEKCECVFTAVALFDWIPSSPFITVNLSAFLNLDGEGNLLDQIRSDFLPNGTFILRFDKVG